jgi:hypothetical protein
MTTTPTAHGRRRFLIGAAGFAAAGVAAGCAAPQQDSPAGGARDNTI